MVPPPGNLAPAHTLGFSWGLTEFPGPQIAYLELDGVAQSQESFDTMFFYRRGPGLGAGAMLTIYSPASYRVGVIFPLPTTFESGFAVKYNLSGTPYVYADVQVAYSLVLV